MKNLKKTADRLRIEPDLLIKAAVSRFIRLPENEQIESVKKYLRILNNRK